MAEADNAVITQRNGISKIWFVPLMALILGIWMVYAYLDDKGTMITIVMPNAEGISPGKTQIKTRSVPIGLITEVHLTDDRRQVEVTAEIEKRYDDLLTKDAQIWAVQPRIDQSGISGLGTLLSGIYFEFRPGNAQENSDEFTVLPEPPLVSINLKGKRYELISYNADAMAVGSPVYFKGYNVGTIEKAQFDWQQQVMNYQVFIQDPYHNLITQKTLFWVETGLEMDLSADGLSVRAGPLTKFVDGGITFGVPNREDPGAIAKENSQFVLSKSYSESLEERYPDYQYYVVMFEHSIRGLRAGAPVEYRGVRIGTVVEVPLNEGKDGMPVLVTENNTDIPVLIKVEFARINEDVALAENFWRKNIGIWLKNGLRASMETGSLITGALFVNVDFYQRDEKPYAATFGGYNVIPSTADGFTQLTDQMSGFLNKLNALEIEKTLARIDDTLASFSSLAESTEKIVSNANIDSVPKEITDSLEELQTTLQSYQEGSPLYNDIQNAIQSMEVLMKQIQPLAEELSEHPNILIFDKPDEDDVQPKARGNE
ncbi:intermembrane transport protein PqiB [Enterovibrio norvegicus]|uniref:intermembrane transport protein PqiB n=1 Tax=Enterovibrio norvegicus TaxID=188144 RepID=UPI00352EFF27